MNIRRAAIRRFLANGRIRNALGGSHITHAHPTASDLPRLRHHYASFPVPNVGYGTVRDFSDSLEHLRALATAQGDLKDAQRPWMVKALWSIAPKHGRVIEIGAGQPFVADLLKRSGLDVTIVDPYDGSGNGPTEYAAFRERYPELTFVRARFDADIVKQLPVESYDAVYSISVLEHLSAAELAAVTAGTHALLRQGGRSVHSVDHSLLGWDQAASLERVLDLSRQHGVAEDRLLEVLRTAESDPETYYLSAESHERWRAYLGLGYAEYPMQRVVSINIAAAKEQLRAGSSVANPRPGQRAQVQDVRPPRGRRSG